MIEVQCSSCHTRYRIDEQVLPEGTPTFKCSRCGHVFSLEPRGARASASKVQPAAPPLPPETAAAPLDAVARRAETAQFDAVDSIAADAPIEPGPTPPVEVSEPAVVTAGPAAAGIAQAREPAPKRKSAEPVEPAENLSFDFQDEPPVQAPRPAQPVRAAAAAAAKPDAVEPQWQVGDEVQAPPRQRARPRFSIGAPEFDDAESGGPEMDPEPESEFVDESAAPIYNRGVAHTSRFVVALFLLIALGFAILTLAIHNAPAAALEALNHVPVLGGRFPIPFAPARMVALRDVHGAFEAGPNGARDLVVRGSAENVSQTPLSAVKINVALGGAPLQREVYCGNNLETRTLSQMTAHELDFFQKLAPRDFELQPAASCPFVAVFTAPPADARDFQLEVTQALPASGAASAGSSEPAAPAGDEPP